MNEETTEDIFYQPEQLKAFKETFGRGCHARKFNQISHNRSNFNSVGQEY